MLRIVEDGNIVSLVVDGAEQSRIDQTNPGRLEFEYMQQIDAAITSIWAKPLPLKVAHVGGGICALPWAIECGRPGSSQIAFEVDPQIAELAREKLPLPRKPRLRIRISDGRAALEQSKAHFDVIVRDAFLGTTVPSHLHTTQWYEIVKTHLNSQNGGGLYAANAAHGRGIDARNDIAAAAAVFNQIAVIGESKVIKNARWGNLIILAWDDPGLVNLDQLDRSLRKLPLPASLMRQARVQKWISGITASQDRPPTV